MGIALIEHMRHAFNGGDIRPTVFVFPPRSAGKRGPMIWNSQLLSFAAYTMEDGAVLGDPANLDLTRAILELGWQPPKMRSRWDLLPLVTMAEGDNPIMTGISVIDFPLVRIMHSKHELAFEKLGLRWVPAPALSRLGFDIGGVQYTAAPFVGWFMDAEIAVRDLADKSRYDVLPAVATALGFTVSTAELDRAPEYEKLSILSRAQAELNFAVYYSFKEAGVMMSDTLSASSMYSKFDDEHFNKTGFRLPSNPYWLAPPQGSIIPIWHRGGAPNYQPTPLICRHVQDPIKAWKREKCDASRRTESRLENAPHDHRDQRSRGRCNTSDIAKSSIRISYCSVATTAEKLARHLYKRTREHIKMAPQSTFHVAPPTILNELELMSLGKDDRVLIVASTAGQGDVPANGWRFCKARKATSTSIAARFSIFGNGSTTYPSTYNAAAKKVRKVLLDSGFTPIGSGMYEGDTSIDDPPWSQFDQWFEEVSNNLLSGQSASGSGQKKTTQQTSRRTVDIEKITAKYSRADYVSSTYSSVTGIRQVCFDVHDASYSPLSHVAIIVPNKKCDVSLAIKALDLSGKEQLGFTNLTSRDYLTEFVDLDQPFTSIGWASDWNLCTNKMSLIRNAPVRQALRAFWWPWRSRVSLNEVFYAMPLKRPRTYSVACPQDLIATRGKMHQLELLIQPREGGLVSDFLLHAKPGQQVRMRFTGTKMECLLNDVAKPTICFATGSGLAPLRSLLQHRLHQLREEQESVGCAPITLVLGLREQDAGLIANVLKEPISAGIIDMLLMTPSNPDKRRAQDQLFEEAVRSQIETKLKQQDAAVFVCASSAAATDFASNLSAIIGCDIQEALGERYVQEVFKPAT